MLAGVVICVAGWVGSGCALRGSDSARPSAPETQAGDALETHIEKVRHLSARPLAGGGSLPRIEQQDVQLSGALQQLAGYPSGERHRRVAARYRALGVPDVAFQHFSRALALNPRDAGAYDGLARIWRDWGLPHLALGDAHRALFYAPSSAAAHNTMGTILQALGQDDRAKSAYERAIRLEPRAVYALSNLCYLSFLRGDFTGAEATCRSALALDPAFAAARNNLALTHAAAGRLDLARTQFMDAGDAAVGSFNMGIVHLALRDYPRAVVAFDSASRANPSMHMARARATQARVFARAVSDGNGGPR